jgi:hypothetical protein
MSGCRVLSKTLPSSGMTTDGTSSTSGPAGSFSHAWPRSSDTLPAGTAFQPTSSDAAVTLRRAFHRSSGRAMRTMNRFKGRPAAATWTIVSSAAKDAVPAA